MALFGNLNLELAESIYSSH